MSSIKNTACLNYDIAIAGGGIAGVTAAIGLAKLGLSVVLIEAVQPDLEVSPSFDQRAVALSACSVAIYQSLGLWSQLTSIASPIKQISVSDQGQFGFTRLDAEDYAVEALGQVIPLDQTGPILWNVAKREKNINIFCPAKVESVESTTDACIVEVKYLSENKNKRSTQLQAQLLLAADGTYSHIAKQLEIPVSRESYGQHAVIANIVTELPHQNKAFERFTKSGPLALLPLTELAQETNRMSLVWCQSPDHIEQIMANDDELFIEQLQQAFGFRLGRITKVGKRSEYPLSLHIAQQSFNQRVLLLGNSAHTLHPIAGQGFNLGLRDIAMLVEQVEQATQPGNDFGDESFLTQYNESRQADWQQTIFATDALARLFSNQFLPLVFARNKAMNAVNNLPLLKKHLARSAMGYIGRSSRLARGIMPVKKQHQDKCEPS